MGGIVEKRKVTTLDKIRKYYLKGPDAVTLSPKQEEIRILTYKAWNLFINYHSTEQAIKVLMNEAACSRAAAYRYVTFAKSVFGDPEENFQQAEAYLIREDLMRLQQRAIKKDDPVLELNVIKQRIKLGAFDKQKDPKFDPEKLRAQVYIVKAHPSAIAALEQARNGGSYNFNTDNAQDIDFIDLPDDEFKKEDQDEE